mgnify:CR=1 FL=1
MSGLCSAGAALLSSTPPLAFPTPSPAGRHTGKRGSGLGLVSFRSDVSENMAGSLKASTNGLSRSFTAEGSAHSLGRSLSSTRAAGRTSSSEGGPPAAAPPSASAATAPGFAGLQHSKSIPKSPAFVKIEGFQPEGGLGSPLSSAPPSPAQSRTLASLLSRQLSTDRLPMLSGSPTLGMTCGASTCGPLGYDDPSSVGGLAGRLEAGVRLAPVPRPAPLTHRGARPLVPDNLLEQLQVCGS